MIEPSDRRETHLIPETCNLGITKLTDVVEIPLERSLQDEFKTA